MAGFPVTSSSVQVIDPALETIRSAAPYPMSIERKNLIKNENYVQIMYGKKRTIRWTLLILKMIVKVLRHTRKHIYISETDKRGLRIMISCSKSTQKVKYKIDS